VIVQGGSTQLQARDDDPSTRIPHVEHVSGFEMPKRNRRTRLAHLMLESRILWEDVMNCCGHAHTHAPSIWSPALIPVGAMLNGEAGPLGSTAAAETAETASAALDALRNTISVDVHTHGGKTGITSKAPPNDDLAEAMRSGSLAAACLADVPDGPILARNEDGALATVRTPEPGELYRHHLERLAWMDEMVANHGLCRALSASDLEATP